MPRAAEPNNCRPTDEPAAAACVARIAWTDVAAELDRHGCAVIGPLLSARQCRSVSAMFASDPLFRSRIVMARHGFGRGEYKYFAYPLPPLIEALRTALYPPLAEVANRWNEALGIAVRYPTQHADFLERCHSAGQSHPTPLLLQYETGDYNCLHQDIYGEHVFPLQVAILLSAPGEDFTGGEFVLTEQRPRLQSRRGGAPPTGGRRGISGAGTPGARHARNLSRQHAPRRQPAALGPTPYAGADLPRREVGRRRRPLPRRGKLIAGSGESSSSCGLSLAIPRSSCTGSTLHRRHAMPAAAARCRR